MASGDAGEILRQIADLKRDVEAIKQIDDLKREVEAIKRSVTDLERQLRREAIVRTTERSLGREDPRCSGAT